MDTYRIMGCLEQITMTIRCRFVRYESVINHDHEVDSNRESLMDDQTLHSSACCAESDIEIVIIHHECMPA